LVIGEGIVIEFRRSISVFALLNNSKITFLNARLQKEPSTIHNIVNNSGNLSICRAGQETSVECA